MVRLEEETALELHLLDRGLAWSSVKIGFDKVDHTLTQLRAQDDSISLRLSTNPNKDPEKIFMASYLMRQIFKDLISSRNPEFLKRADYSRPRTSSATVLRQALPSASGKFGLSSSFPSLPSRRASTPSPPRPIAPKSSSVLQSQRVMSKLDPTVDRAVGISNRPRAFLTMQLENENPFRVVVELRPDLAPTLVDNFLRLCKGTKEGRGYKESKVLTVLSSTSLLIFDNFYQIFRCSPNERIEGGDFEKNDGTGGHSAFNTKDFLAEQVMGQAVDDICNLSPFLYRTLLLSSATLQKNCHPTSLGASQLDHSFTAPQRIKDVE